MTRIPTRVLVAALLGVILLHPAFAGLALAASGTVQGRVNPMGGPLPPGTIVRATPLGGGAPLAAPVAADGTYVIRQIPEGAYQFDVIGPDGTQLGTAKTLVTPAPLQLNLVARVAAPPPPPPPAVPREEPEDESEEAIAKPPRDGTGRGWKITAAILGGLAVGVALADDDDDDASPSTP
jgi:hypothetical protein